MAETIRYIDVDQIAKKTKALFLKANCMLPIDIKNALLKARESERNPLAKEVLSHILTNAERAQDAHLALCQDTGIATVFVEIGQDVHITGGTLEEAINRGIREAYFEGHFRCSVVDDPLFDRKNTNDNTPASIHIRLVSGSNIRLICMPKGFGSENVSVIKMMSPSATEDDIISLVLNTIISAGGKPCPPLVVGVGIGGTFDTVGKLAKEALTMPLDEAHSEDRYAKLAHRILEAINQTGVGPQGFGGNTTALGVNIKTAPTHIAGLPVAICVCCHSCRRAMDVI